MSFSIFEAVQVRIAGEKRGHEPQLADLLGGDAVHWYINTETIGFSAKYGAKKWSRGLTDGSRKKFSFVWPRSMKVSYFVYVFAFCFVQVKDRFYKGTKEGPSCTLSFSYLWWKAGSFSISLRRVLTLLQWRFFSSSSVFWLQNKPESFQIANCLLVNIHSGLVAVVRIFWVEKRIKSPICGIVY